MLKARNISVKKGAKQVLRGLNFELAAGRVSGILGANGAGKSTLLDALFQLDERHDVRLSAGGVVLGEDAKRYQSEVGYMLQNFHTHANLSALEVVLMGAYEQLNLAVSERLLDEALRLLEYFNLLELANSHIAELSGGQRQLVAFAQVLLKRPRALLLDEPVSALDLRHQCLLLEALREQTRARDLVSAVVLHDLNLASAFCDEVLVLQNGQIRAFGSPREVLTAELIGEIYGVQAQVIALPDGAQFIRVLRAN